MIRKIHRKVHSETTKLRVAASPGVHILLGTKNSNYKMISLVTLLTEIHFEMYTTYLLRYKGHSS